MFLQLGSLIVLKHGLQMLLTAGKWEEYFFSFNKIYDDCDVTFRENFEEKINGMPLLYKNGVGQYDLQNNLIREFSCKYDCLKTLLMSDKTLAKALDKEKQYNGFYYKSIGSKLKCV